MNVHLSEGQLRAALDGELDSQALDHLALCADCQERQRRLQSQLEGTENRIAVARMDFNKAAQDYNTARLRFPTNLMAGILGFKEKPYFKAAAGAERAPSVQFNFQNPPATAPAPAK